jgi:hypothetical protein
MATVLEQLHARLGDADESVYGRALRTLAAALPVERRVELTDDVIRAAANGDIALVVTLLAPESPAEGDEIEALVELEREPDRQLLDADAARRELEL